MRTSFMLLTAVGLLPGVLLILLTFFGFPQWSGFTERVIGQEPEVVHYYSVTKNIAGKKVSFQFVRRTLRHKLAPTIVLLIGTSLQLGGVFWYVLAQGE